MKRFLTPEVIEYVQTYANDKNVISNIEPHVKFPQKVDTGQVERVIYGFLLFVSDWSKKKKEN